MAKIKTGAKVRRRGKGPDSHKVGTIIKAVPNENGSAKKWLIHFIKNGEVVEEATLTSGQITCINDDEPRTTTTSTNAESTQAAVVPQRNRQRSVASSQRLQSSEAEEEDVEEVENETRRINVDDEPPIFPDDLLSDASDEASDEDIGSHEEEDEEEDEDEEGQENNDGNINSQAQDLDDSEPGTEDYDGGFVLEEDIETNAYRHQQRMERYQTEKRQLLRDGYYVECEWDRKGKAKNLRPNILVKVIQQGHRLEGRIGRLLSRLSETSQKWNILFKHGGDIDQETVEDHDPGDTNSLLFTMELLSRYFYPLYQPYGVWKWTVTEKVERTCEKEVIEYNHLGLIGFDFHDHFVAKKHPLPFLRLLIHLWPGKWRDQLAQMNNAIKKENRKKTKKIRPISENEFWKFVGIIISSCAIGKGGSKLWDRPDKKVNIFGGTPIVTHDLDFDEIMKYYRFNDLKHIFPSGFEDLEATERKDDSWSRIRGLIDGFNKNRNDWIAASSKKIMDESMSAFRPQKSATGNLPNISFVKRKPEPLGTEFKNIACAVLGVMLFLVLMEGKERMQKKKYTDRFQSHVAVTMRLVEGSEYCGKFNEERTDARSDNAREHFEGDSYFASASTAEQMALRGHEFCGPVKNNSRFIPIKELESKMKDWPSGSFLLMKTVTPISGVTLYLIGYKYNSKTVTIFIFTPNVGTTEKGVPYVAKYRDHDGVAQEREIFRPQVCSQYFSTCNMIDKHNQSRQYDLKLEKHFITEDGYFRIFTTVLGFCTTDGWKLFKKKLESLLKDKDVTIQEFSSWTANDCINNTFSGDDDSSTPPISMQALQRMQQEDMPFTLGGNGSRMSHLSDLTPDDAAVASTCLTLEQVQSLHYFKETDEYEGGKCARRKRRMCGVKDCKLPTTGNRCRTSLRCWYPACKATNVTYCQRHISVHHQKIWDQIKQDRGINEGADEE